jgi:hypothetical protein
MRYIAEATAKASKGVRTGKQWSRDRETVRKDTSRLSGVGTVQADNQKGRKGRHSERRTGR